MSARAFIDTNVFVYHLDAAEPPKHAIAGDVVPSAVRARWRLGFQDSLIVADALAARCTALLSEDLQQGQRIDSLTVIDPLRA